MDTQPGKGLGLSSTDGQLGRRLACDRCRAQKLKCERSNILDCCQRCRKADAQCSFGRPLPPGRPRNSDLAARTGSSAQDEQPKAAVRTASFGEVDATASASTVQPGHRLEQLMPDDAVQDPPSLSSGTVAESITAIADTPWPYEPAGHLEDDNMMDMFCDNDFAADFENDPTFASWSAPGTADSTPVESRVHVTGDMMGTHTHTKSKPLFFPYQRPKWIASQPPANLLETVQRATELGNAMNELHANYARGDFLKKHTLRDGFPIQFSGEVLHLTNDFLTILRCFFLDNAGSSVVDSSHSNHSNATTSTSTTLATRQDHLYAARAHTNIFAQQPRNDCGPMRGHPNSQGRADMLDNESPHTGANIASQVVSTNAWQQQHPSPRAPRRTSTDKPAALQLIASHQRLLDLHLLFYKAVYDYLHSSQGHAKPPIWQDLALGGASLGLHKFADLQIKLVLQAMARVLAEVEGTLGLPGGCRVSSKSAAEGDGILGSIVSAHFVDMCMAEEGAGTEQGRGAIARIHEITIYVARMLDTPGPGAG